MKQNDALAVSGIPMPTGNKARRRHDGKNVLQAMQQEQILNSTNPKVQETSATLDTCKAKKQQKSASFGSWVIND